MNDYHHLFPDFPDKARLWVRALDRPLDGAQQKKLEAEMERILSQWKTHGQSIESTWSLLHDQLLIVVEKTVATQLTGCAIDGMLQQVHHLVEQLGLSLLDHQRVLFRRDHSLISAAKEELKERLEEGSLNASTPVIDLSLGQLGSLRRGQLERPLAETWIGRKYGIRATATAANL